MPSSKPSSAAVKQFFESERSGEDLYEISHRIGKGSYGTVCAGRNRSTNDKVAIKHIDRVFADKADTVRIIRELRFLRLLKHPNIVAVSDVLIPQRQKAFDDIYIVTVSFRPSLGRVLPLQPTTQPQQPTHRSARAALAYRSCWTPISRT
jgi:serine/threonine protein kinase